LFYVHCFKFTVIQLLNCYIVSLFHCSLFFTKYEFYEYTNLQCISIYFYLFLSISIYFIVLCLLFFTKYEFYECTNLQCISIYFELFHCSTFIVHCPLPTATAHCYCPLLLPTANCPLPPANCLLPTASCPLPPAHCPLPTVLFSIFYVTKANLQVYLLLLFQVFAYKFL